MANGHGGARPGAGRPRKSLADKQLEGFPGKRRPKVLNIPDDAPELEFPERLSYYTSRMSGKPDVQEIWQETADWLKKTGCLHLINPAFIEEYAILKSRFYEMERIISHTNPIYDSGKADNKKIDMNPAVEGSLRYLKMADAVWGKIWAIVAQNSEMLLGDDPHADAMSFLLNNKPGGRR